jgi:hypothetical protein
MKTYQVWYMRPEWFRTGSLRQKPDPLNLSATHIHLKDIEAEGLEPVWVAMQGENWSPNGEARGLIEAKGLRHTSMSVGDVAVDTETGNVYLVASLGFKNLSNKETIQ